MLLVPFAHALTLQETVERAAEVDPFAIIAELEWRQARLDAAEAWTAMGPTPQIRLSQSLTSDIGGGNVQVTVPLLDVPGWLNAGEQSAQARSMYWASEATTLDVQYAAAVIFYETLAAQSGLEAARQQAEFAVATATATDARVAAGLESELIGKSAQILRLQADADIAAAEASLAIARARLARALEMPIEGELVAEAPPALPGSDTTSPWLQAAGSSVTAAKVEHVEALAGLLPVGEIVAESAGFPETGAWTVELQATWTFDGLVGPVIRARHAALSQRIAKVYFEGLERDIDLGITVAAEQARAASRLAEAARARETLAEEAWKVGQTRLSVGLASSWEVLRLQDDAAKARVDRVEAEYLEAWARLEARRLAGIAW